MLIYEQSSNKTKSILLNLLTKKNLLDTITKNILSKEFFMAIIAGQAVRGDNFWDRPYLMDDILDVIESGGHILLVAPRRVGKTSLMYRVLDTKGEEYVIVYINTEAEHSVDAFWEKLFHELMDEEFIATFSNKAKSFFHKLSSIRLSEAGIKGVKFGESEAVDYKKAFLELLKSFDGESKLIIMLDEFSQTIENIIQHESTEKAEQLLQAHREIRQNKKISEQIVFVYAGSIGLESVVANINSSKHINDLVSISVPPLESEEALAFAKELCEKNSIEIAKSDIEYMLDKIKWYIPFYIQLITQEIKRLYRRHPEVSTVVIDKAIDNALQNRKDFIHWEERLGVFSKNGRKYAKEILSLISEKTDIASNELSNLATKHQLKEEEAKEIVHALKYDGYINNSDDPKTYRFNSPLLRIWWYNNVAN
jgi:AAA+ ATPase superfamily predicted ATPase